MSEKNETWEHWCEEKPKPREEASWEKIKRLTKEREEFAEKYYQALSCNAALRSRIMELEATIDRLGHCARSD
jgi:hypothetical protein